MNNSVSQKGRSAFGPFFTANHLLAADLFCCTVWLLFAFHFYYASYRMSILPLMAALIRLAVSVDLYRRLKLAIIPILMLLAVGICEIINGFDYSALTGISFLYIADYSKQCVDYTMYYTPLHDMYANNEIGMRTAVMLLGWTWAAFMPAVIYGVMAYRKLLRKSDGERKGWLVWSAALVVTLVMLFCIGRMSWPYHMANRVVYIVLLVTIPFLVWKQYRILRDPIWKRYGAFLIVLALAYISGYTMNPTATMVCVPLTAVMLYWLINKCVKRSCNARELAFMALGAGVFVIATYTLWLLKAALLSLSALIIGWICWRFYRATRRPVLAVVTFIACAVVMPSIAIGYNQYRAWNTRSLMLCSGVDDITTGVSYVVDQHGDYGIRDRYGLILPPCYQDSIYRNISIEPLNRHTTYFCVRDEQSTYIVDIRTKKGTLVTKEHTRLIPIGERTYKAVKRTYIDQEPWHKDSICAYVLLPRYSYHIEKIVVSDRPIDENSYDD